MIKKFFNKEINSITIAAVIIAGSSLVSRLLGVLRDRILAGQFGAGQTLDVYYAAFRVPDFIFNIVVMGAITAGLVPVFTGLINDRKDGKQTLFSNDNKEAWALINNLLNLLLLALAVLSVLGFIFAAPLMKILAPGFSDEAMRQATGLTRIMFLSPIFLGISSIFGGVLQSFKRFFAYSFAPILYNLGIIMGALFFVPVLGIYGLAWGVVFGAALHMVIQMSGVFSLNYKYKIFLNLTSKNLRKILSMMVPRTLTLASSQINLMAITAIASTLVTGSVTIFNLANNLQYFPVGIFGISFAVAAFPTLAAVAWSKDKTINSFSGTFRQILFFIVPSTVLFLTLRAQLTRLVLGSGLFDWNATVLTMNALGYFALSFFAQATIPLLIRVFYARQDSRTPFLISLVSVGANIVLSIVLGGRMGVVGLALAFSISSILNFILLWIFLRHYLGTLDERRVIVSAAKFSLASLAAGFALQAVKEFLGGKVNMDKVWGLLVQGGTATLVGIGVYLLICYLLRSEEMDSFWQSFKCRFL
ncbi:MAG: murein biosynthesis integral membrane protein MurJ [Patescibacteria group bacterium]|jgi:putative peptidoglycan lipid II flippase